MKTIDVHTKFGVTNADGSTTVFEKGVQSIDDELAEHWYVKANSDPVEPVVQRNNKQPKAAK